MSRTLATRFRYSFAAAAIAAVGTAVVFVPPAGRVEAEVAPAAPAATEVDVAEVAARDVATWSEYSGRLEAVDNVEVRSRVAGQVQSINFREGALVEKGAPLVTIDPAPYQAEVDRAKAELASAEARVVLARADLDRGRKMTAITTISQRDLDNRINALSEAEASVEAAKAVLRTAELNLSYTDVRAPIAGRVDRIEVTVGNLVAAGPGAPVLTRLISVSPIYASFDADEVSVLKALDSIDARGDRRQQVADIPVEMTLPTSDAPVRGKLQLVGAAVDAGSGTIRVRATFDNEDGRLMPGQFARLRMGQAKTNPALLVSERAVGVDQDKKFVLVVDAENKAVYREVKLGAPSGGLRVVTEGLAPGERVVVNGLQKVRPGALLAPQPAPMDAVAGLQKQASR